MNEFLDNQKLKYPIFNVNLLDSSIDSVLSRCSNFPSAQEPEQFKKLLPDISSLRERVTPEQLTRLRRVLVKKEGAFVNKKMT